jgi:hypothetical protein
MTDATLPPPPEPGERLTDDVVEAVLAEAATAVDGAAQGLDLTPLDTPRRLLLVHAHPDDETIGTGATMARYVAEGALVTLVTCTLGEEGEVLVPELEHLASDRDDALGQHRIGELAAACEALRVTDHRFLGGPGALARTADDGHAGRTTPAAASGAPTSSEAGPLSYVAPSCARRVRQVDRHLRRQRRLRAPGSRPGSSRGDGRPRGKRDQLRARPR